jgi:hypothetical protein
MFKRVLVPATAFLTLTFAAELVPSHDGLVVHEWGTFTSVAGQDGAAVPWALIDSTADLPCFVDRLGPVNFKMAAALVRMETPVLYFYPRHDMDLSVHVAFPQGWITEWYPDAKPVSPQPSNKSGFGEFRDGRIAWDGLHLSAAQDSQPQFPVGKGASRYYAARNTDAAAITIGQQHEKMIFYRGIGNFGVPLRAKYDTQGALEIRNTGAETIPLTILFENHDGRVGYRMVRDLKDVARLQPPELTANVDALRLALADALVENGLYPKEAAAMLQTWRDSWFEAGSRVIYIVPQAMVNRDLPLTIAPAASTTSRVFVGRIELFSPWVRQTFESALATADAATLAKYGRFLSPFLQEIGHGNPNLLRAAAARDIIPRAFENINRTLQAKCIE